MRGQWRGVAGKHIFSANPGSQMSKSRYSTGDLEFDFWGGRNKHGCDNFRRLSGSDIEVQVEAHMEEGFSTQSPPLWKTIKSRNCRHESSALLQHHRNDSELSPAARRQAIEEGRKELMEMIQSMPESSYELSLKDMVDEQHVLEEVKRKLALKEKSYFSETEAHSMKPKRKKSTKKDQILTSESMDNEVFLLKMFFPTSFGSKGQATIGNSSKLCQRPSLESSENSIDEGWPMKRISVAGNKISGKDSGGGSSSERKSSNIITCPSRHADGHSMPGCWPFFLYKKRKTKQSRGFIF